MDPEPKVIRQPKAINATQRDLDKLAPNSGMYRVIGQMGLFVTAYAHKNTFSVQRRVDGRLVKKTLKAETMTQALAEAGTSWSGLKAETASAKVTVEQMVREYIAEKKGSEKKPGSAATIRTFTGAYERNVPLAWRGRTLYQFADMRAEVRNLYFTLRDKIGLATARTTFKLLSAAYNRRRRIDPHLPDSPTRAVTLEALEPRDWAIPPAEFRKWWEEIVTTRTPAVCMYNLILVLTGCRRDSAQSLEVEHVNFDDGTIYFAGAKRRPYTVPASDLLLRALAEWKQTLTLGSKYILPGKKPNTHMQLIRGRSHDKRCTFSADAEIVGVHELTTEILLGHKLQGVGRKYKSVNRLTDPVRAGANAMSDYYAKILGIDTEHPTAVFWTKRKRAPYGSKKNAQVAA